MRNTLSTFSNRTKNVSCVDCHFWDEISLVSLDVCVCNSDHQSCGF